MHAKKAITAAKRKKIAERNRQRNLPIKTKVKRSVRTALSALEAGGDPSEARQLVFAATRRIDQAASKGVLHRRTAARKKSRIMRRLNSLTAASA